MTKNSLSLVQLKFYSHRRLLSNVGGKFQFSEMWGFEITDQRLWPYDVK